MVEKILIIVNLVVVLAGAGAVYYSHNLIKPIPTDQKAEEEALKTNAAAEAQLQPVPLKKIVVNLYSKATRLRYLDIDMSVLTFHEDQKEIVKNHEYIFKDVVVEIAAHLTPEELESMTGKILLENKIKKTVNTKLGQPVIRQIFFSGFVVQ